MNATQGSGSSSQQDSQSLPPQTKSVNDSEPIQIDDDEPEDMDFDTKRKLTSVVWNDFKKVKSMWYCEGSMHSLPQAAWRKKHKWDKAST
jgi:hypothetical protein